MALQRVDELKEPPVIGKRYLVPHVMYRWIHLERARLWPVLGPKHNDAEHLNFEPVHYHVDGRFLSIQEWRSATKYMDHRPQYGGPEAAIAAVPLTRRGEPVPGTVIYRARKCNRTVFYPDFLAGRHSPFTKFWNSFSGKPCTRDANGILICPHKGAPLSGIAPDADGNITCPLHGLRFTPSGESVPRLAGTPQSE